jgi:hypothetical protein
MAKYATGKYAKAISDRSGLEFPYTEMVREWNGSLVHVSEFEPKQPQLEPKPMNGDAISLRNVRPSREAPAVLGMIPENSFETYASGSGIINVSFAGHGLTTSTTYRFRGSPTTSPGTGTPTNAVFAFSNPADFDGISGSNVAKAAGYTVTTGKYISDTGSGSPGRDTSDYSVANFFHFTVDTDTATKGGVSGGGIGCSVGPVTLSA